MPDSLSESNHGIMKSLYDWMESWFSRCPRSYVPRYYRSIGLDYENKMKVS